ERTSHPSGADRPQRRVQAALTAALRQELAGVHDPGGVELGLERAQRRDPVPSDLIAHPRRVVAADGVVVGDRAAVRADRSARGFLGLTPLRDLLALALAR